MATRKTFIHYVGVGYTGYEHHPPIRKWFTAGTPNLIREEFDGTALDSIIVRLNDPIFVSVAVLK